MEAAEAEAEAEAEADADAEAEAEADADIDIDANASTRMHVDAMQGANLCKNGDMVWGGFIDSSLDISTGTWPWLENLSFDDMHLEGEWRNPDSNYIDVVLESLGAFEGDGRAREGLDPPLSTQLPWPPSPGHPHAYAHTQPGGGISQKSVGCNQINIDKTKRGDNGGGDMSNKSLDKNTNHPSLVMVQLSQLSMRLSSLRYSSYNFAKAAEPSSSCLPKNQQIPFIDTATFESVTAWLALGHGTADVNTRPSVYTHTENESPYPSRTSQTKPRGSHGILHDVFSASHLLLEILGQLQADNMTEPFSSPMTTSASTLSSAAFGHRSALFGLTTCPESSSRLNRNQGYCDNTMQTIRHLVTTCEALLLETYVAVLNALQHEAYPSVSANATALGDVRLVLVVQLCSYLIERQHQAVDTYLASQTSLSPVSVSVSKPFSPMPNRSSWQQPPVPPPGPITDTPDRKVLDDLKNQVQHRLVHLRQTLRCT